MPFMPLAVLPMWIFGLLSLALLFGGGYIVYEWWQGAIVATAVLVAGIAMLAVAVLGRFIVLAFHRGGDDDPTWAHDAQTQRVDRPDGTVLHVEASGPDGGLAIVLVHGWGVDNRHSTTPSARCPRTIASLRGTFADSASRAAPAPTATRSMRWPTISRPSSTLRRRPSSSSGTASAG